MRTGAVVVGLALTACLVPVEERPPGAGEAPRAFLPPAGTVALNFTVDDRANRVYGPGELSWQGTLRYDSVTRLVEEDRAAGGPFPDLYDDGPWTLGGHEPVGATAGDHVWGITVFARPPDASVSTYEVELVDVVSGLWFSETVARLLVWAGPAGHLDAPTFTLEPFGHSDLTLVLDTTALASRPFGGSWDTTRVTVRSGALAGYLELPLRDDGRDGDAVAGDGRFTLVLSRQLGPGTALPRLGLPWPGPVNLDLQLGDSLYRDAESRPFLEGVSASAAPDGGPPVALPLFSLRYALRLTLP